MPVIERDLRAVGAALYAVVRVEDVDDPNRALVRPAPGVARRLDGGAGGAVVRAVPGQDLRAAGDGARDLDRVLVRVVAAEREEDLVDVARQQLRQLLAETRPDLGRHEWADVGEKVGLALDRVDDPLVAMAGVDAHQLAVEVDETAAVHCLKMHALGARHHKWLERRLGRPVV